MSDMDVIPHHSAGLSYDAGGSMDNIRLRLGEVQAMYLPSSAFNVSKRVTEYDVLVSHHTNGTAVTKIYSHCYVQDLFGGVADTFTYTLRADKSGYRTPLAPGLGSKVLIHCIEGHQNNAVIIGGIKDMASEVEDESLGHHLLLRFNGLQVTINKDGELLLERQGPQEMDGSLRSDIDEKTAGTTISMDVKGNVEISDAVKDADGNVTAKNIILLDHENNIIAITGDAEIQHNAPKVTLGQSDATEPVPMGNQLTSLLSDLIDAILTATYPTPEGPSGTCFNFEQFQQIQSRLQSTLSQISFTK